MSETTIPGEECEICRAIPDRVSNTTKGDETRGEPLPPAVGRLFIVGAPVYDDDTSHSNWALHKCPLCGTFYSWEFEYEYLAGGSEDSTVFTRLDAETGERLERECLAEVERARERARQDVAEHVAAIVTSADASTISWAATSVFLAGQRGFEVDVTDAVPTLVRQLTLLPPDGGPGTLRWDLRRLLLPWVGTSPERAREVLRLIGASGAPAPGEDARAVAARCEAVLAEDAAGPR